MIGKIKNIFNGDLRLEVLYCEERFAQEYKKQFYQPAVSLLENLITLGLAKVFRFDTRPYAPSFFKTLISNLKGGV